MGDETRYVLQPRRHERSPECASIVTAPRFKVDDGGCDSRGRADVCPTAASAPQRNGRAMEIRMSWAGHGSRSRDRT
jgi:hypothetical protein